MTQALRERAECPVCNTRIEDDWRSCPECGTEFGRAAARMTPAPSGSALPSTDTGEVGFVPLITGGHRPITVVGLAPVDSAEPGIPLASLTQHKDGSEGTLSAPVSETTRKPITIVREDEVEAPLEIPERARTEPPRAEQAALERPRAEGEITASSPNIPSTVVVMSHESPLTRRLDREDMAELERMIGQAVERALRAHAAVQAPLQAALLAAPPSARMAPSRRVASVGAGLLVGGALTDLLVLNWDTWVRGSADSVVGGLQQLGLIGTAAIAGAGAAAFVLGASRRRHRVARAQ